MYGADLNWMRGQAARFRPGGGKDAAMGRDLGLGPGCDRRETALSQRLALHIHAGHLGVSIRKDAAEIDAFFRSIRFRHRHRAQAI